MSKPKKRLFDNKTPLEDYLYIEAEELVPVVIPKYAPIEHRWIQSRCFDNYQEQGYVPALDYYQNQIDYWQSVMEDFQQSYKEEEKYAREVFTSQNMN